MKLSHAHARDLPGYTQEWDYGVRTDGQPVYYGVYRTDVGSTDPKGKIHYYEYDASGFVTKAIGKIGSWFGRSSLFS